MKNIPETNMKNTKTLSEVKDIVAKRHGYADWLQIGMTDIMQCEEDEIKVAMLDDIALEYANQFKPDWVSVEERLPEGQQEVLVYLPKYGSTMAVYFLTDADPTRQTWFNPFWSTKRFDEVTHWMPLPQPPQK